MSASLWRSIAELGDLDANPSAPSRCRGPGPRKGRPPVVFPELSLTGYHLLDQVPDVALAPATGAPESAPGRASREIDIVVGFVEEGAGHRFHNSAAYLSAGEVLHVHRKLFLPTYGMFQEGRDFAAGERLRGVRGAVRAERPAPLRGPVAPDLPVAAGPGGAPRRSFALSNGPTRGARPDGRHHQHRRLEGVCSA